MEFSIIPPTSVLLFVLIVSICLYGLYWLALPKPIPGIPYDIASASRLLGDVPGMTRHISEDKGTFITYIMRLMKELDAPLIQVFIRPFSKPLLILADYHEAHDMLIRRDKDFDRSRTLGDLVKGLAPDHHIHLKTNNAWKSQRRLVQDLMTPTFLHSVVGPVIHHKVSLMTDLWRLKSQMADGQPWKASDDINLMALDAVTAFAFGEEFDHSATIPTLDAVRNLQSNNKVTGTIGGSDDKNLPVEFPKGRVDEVIHATRVLTEVTGEVQGNPIPDLTWWYVMRKSKVKTAVKIKEDYIMKELREAVDRFRRKKSGAETVARSAVDQMVAREAILAQKDGREPDFLSRVMIDELFGFVFAGHETTSTTLCWGLKFLSDNPIAQTKMRTALFQAFTSAKAENREPTIQEITSTQVPFLDATMEECLRCAGTAPVVDRQAIRDTQVLGHYIPEGTVVTCLVTGPSMMSPGFEIEESRRSVSSQTAKRQGKIRAWNPVDIGSFQPERWLVKPGGGKVMDGSDGDESFDPSAGPQLAFGLGTRGCYGKRLVYLEMRILLTLLLWKFELLKCPPELSSYKPVLITTNEPRQCYVRLREINSTA